MTCRQLDVQQQSTYTPNNRRPRCLAVQPQAGGVFFKTRSTWRILLLGCLLITACSSPFTPSPGGDQILTGATISETSVSFKNPSATPIPAATRTPTQPPKTSTCDQTEAEVLAQEIHHADLSQPLAYRIYLPPCYSEKSSDRYPSLYLLHGLGATEQQWDDLGIDEAASHLISAGRTPPFLIIMPSEPTGIDMEQAIVEILVPYIDRTFRARPDPLYRAIGGLSRGAGYALRIGLKNPDVFHAIGLHSPANLYSAPYIAFWFSKIPLHALPKIRVDIGESDPLIKTTRELIALMAELGIEFTAHIQPGSHDSAYWSANLTDYLLWYTEIWKAQMTAERNGPGLPVENDPTLRGSQP